MTKKGLIILLLATFVVVGAFAQKNTLTVDLGPTIVGAGFGAIGGAFDDDGMSSSGFGIGAQYEMQPFESLSFAGRFAYLGFGFGVKEEDPRGDSAKLNMDMTSFSVEGHVRFYPFTGTFFLDGMVGYGRLMMDFSGSVLIEEQGYSYAEAVSSSIARDYIKVGGKIGWRIDFGSPGGFTFEPSLGYYFGIGLGDTLGTKFADSLTGEVSADDIKGFDDAAGVLEQTLFIGGPRVSLAFGWRF